MEAITLLPSRIKTFGSSMFPLLQNQDIIYLKKINFPKVAVNDIVCVKKNKKTFTHRVIYRNRDHLITKGDSNVLSDGKIYPQNIVGIVYKVKRNGQFFNPDDLYLFQSTLYFQEIVKVKKALEKEGVNFVFLKGLPLHLYYEKTHPRRMYADCDILVSQKKFPKTKKILKKLGYKEADTSLSHIQKGLKNKETEISFFKILNDIPVMLDVHLEVVFMMTQLGELNSLYPQIFIDRLTSEFLKEKRVIRIQNGDFPVLSIENLFIYLSLHLFHHNLKGVHRYELITRVINTHKINYKRVAQKIIFYKLQNFTYPCLLLLKKYYSIDFPRDFLKSIEPSGNKFQFIRKVVTDLNLFDDEERTRAGINRFKNIFYLSPRSSYRKLFVFLNPQVIYIIFWLLKRKLSTATMKQLNSITISMK